MADVGNIPGQNGQTKAAPRTLLEVNNLKMHFPIVKGIVFQRVASSKGPPRRLATSCTTPPTLLFVAATP